jgi:diacylglycerol kinase (ATP)
LRSSAASTSAIEAVVDLVSPGDHPLAKQAKDVAAGAVLVASLGALAAGAFVLWERLGRVL